MIFKQLELSGFKSFADRTTLLFEPGVTAIVGPNGVGKSNLADAIKWVLGEQSARELRGGRMEDLIFNGTDTRPPLNVAEVSLTFDNTAKLLPTEYSEVTISRRLYRSGESEYLLNKTTVRLKDIMELLMGTGIGTSAYSLFEQGKIDQLIHARPEERRAIFEEAAGITKYKTQKREALRKLEQTEANLLRLNDVIGEVRRQLAALERQVKKAEIYREQWERLKQLEVTLAQREYHRLHEERRTHEHQAQVIREEDGRLQGQVAAAEQALAERRAELERVDQQYAQARADVQQIVHAIELATEQIRVDGERLAEGQRRGVQHRQEIETLRGQAMQVIAQITELASAIDATESERQQYAAAASQAQAALAAAEIATQQARAIIREQKASAVEAEARVSQCRNEQVKVAALRHAAQARGERLALEAARVAQERQTLAAQMAAPQGLSAPQEGLPVGVNALLEAVRQRQVAPEGIRGVLAHAVQVEPGYEAAIEAAFGDWTWAVIVEDWATAARCVNYLQEQGTGRATFLVRQAIPSSSMSDQRPAAGGPDEPLIARVRTSPDLQPLIEHLLERTYVVSDLATATELQRTAIVPVRFVTRQGERVAATSVTGGSALQGSLNALLRKLDQEAALLAAELAEAQEQLAQREQEEAAAQRAVAEASSQAAQRQAAIAEIQQQIETAARDREQHVMAVAQAQAQLASVDQVRAGRQQSVGLLERSQQQIEATIAAREQEIADLATRETERARHGERLQQEILAHQAQQTRHAQHLEAVAAQRATVAQMIQEATAAVQSAAQHLEAVRQQLHHHELATAQLTYQQERVTSRLQQVYQLQFDPSPEPPAEQAWDRITQECEGLRRKLEGLGPVSLASIEESKELEERLTFLVHQQADLLKAKDDLHEAITKINRTTRAQFKETFQKIQQEFQTTFKILFGDGGEARLVLLDEEDLLESGIEIIARPPGKTPQSISLLSGGEKALTSIALLFAVFRVKPSPFCLLDEIDAPLDEANIDRFTRALKEFLKDSQFIIITHNKKTITMAEVLYGVTMEEQGISRIVSVKLQETAATPAG